MSESTEQPSDLAKIVGDAIYEDFDVLDNVNVVNPTRANIEEIYCLIDAKLAAHEASLWKGASEPPEQSEDLLIEYSSNIDGVFEVRSGGHDGELFTVDGEADFDFESQNVLRWRYLPRPPKDSEAP